MIDADRRPQSASSWDPLRAALPGASRMSARRVLALKRSTSAAWISALDDVGRKGYVAAASATDPHVPQVFELIAQANAGSDGSRLRTDFNAELLALSLDPQARATLGSALRHLLALGLLVRRSEGEYSVTEAGARAMRRAPVAMCEG